MDNLPNNHKTDILLIGLNHTTASVEVRECFAFNPQEADTALETLIKEPVIEEVLLLSTCNRVEILLTTGDPPAAEKAVFTFLSQSKTVPYEEFKDSLYRYSGDDAVRHVFRVASSLDSMMVGEPQILGQIKDAYRMACQGKTPGVILNRLLHRTFSVAKKVRSETGIGGHAVSISYAAIELGRKIFGSLQDRKVLLIGAGEMAELAVEHLKRNRAGDILVANRTFERGVELAGRFKGKAVRFEEIPDCLARVDIIISSTGSTEFVIRPEQVRHALRTRRNRPLFFIDIAVPRDIDPDINRLNNTYVYDIDDLKGVIDENIEDRRKEAIKAERIVDEAVIRFRQWFESLRVVPTIIALRNKLDSIADAEIKKTFQSLDHLSEKDRQAIQNLVNSIIKKMLHDPMMLLKKDSPDLNPSVCLDMARKLFNLGETASPHETAPMTLADAKKATAEDNEL